LVVDDHGIVRDGLIALLERHDGIRVVGFAASGREALNAAAKLKPDIVIMDLVLPDMNGIDATEKILKVLPEARVLVLTACHNVEHVYRALRAGASGYLVKDAAAQEILQAINTVREGKQYISSSVAPPEADGRFFSMPKSPLERLSSREREVLHRVVAGASSAAIARHLSLSRKTVDTYRGRVMSKLGVRNRSALIRFAMENELTEYRVPRVAAAG
jgi:DNA-binding NarL/FixJ family response regulator